MATMEVILTKKIDGLGAEADLVTVRAGYGRNYLIPQGFAHEATRANRRYVKALQAAREKREADELSEAQAAAQKIAGLSITLELAAGQGGKAYGAITNQDIHKALSDKGVEIDRHSIELDKPIKTGGKYEIGIKLNPKVTATLAVTVKMNGEEEAAAE